MFAALRTLGYEDGRTAAVELLGGEGDVYRLNTLVAELAAQSPDVIVALTEPAVLGLRQAGVTTPVVFAFVTDPVALGIGAIRVNGYGLPISACVAGMTNRNAIEFYSPPAVSGAGSG